jgi:hypothetical protein
MKKILLLCLIILGIQSGLRACDICGGGISNYNPFLFPHLSRTYLSLSYAHRHYQRQSESGIMESEQFHSFLLAGQYSIGKHFQVIAMVPFQNNTLVEENVTKHISGPGDIDLLVNYKLWDKISSNNRQTILIGGGIKLPTGKYTAGKAQSMEEASAQAGTGSLDYLLNASYRISFSKWVFSAAASYKYNTQNKDGYRFGDVITSGATIVYRQDLKGFSIAPYTQFILEKQMKDAGQHIIQDHSGGHAFYTGAGLDINTKKIAVGFNYQFAASQNLAQGEISVKPRITAHISFLL